MVTDAFVLIVRERCIRDQSAAGRKPRLPWDGAAHRDDGVPGRAWIGVRSGAVSRTSFPAVRRAIPR